VDITTRLALRSARSMEIFADGEPTFIFGEWRAWQKACYAEGRQIPPAEFKAWTDGKRKSYLRHIFTV